MLKKVKEGYIIEATTGNMGISVAAIGARLNKKVTIVIQKGMSEERKKLIQLFGAKVITAENMKKAKEIAKELAKKKKGVFLNQFENKANFIAHYKAGKKIARHFKNLDYFVAGIGTGGTLSGIGKALKERFPKIKIIGVLPKEENHKIEGIGDNINTPLLNKVKIDKIAKVSSKDAIKTAREIARKEGIAVGISSGANVFVARKFKGTVLTVLPDSAERYFSTQLFNFGGD